MTTRALLAAFCCLPLAAAPLGAQPSPQQVEFFEKQVRPVLAEHCWRCHGQKKQMAGLRLDSRAALLQGGDNGPVIVAGEPDRSRLVQAVRHAGPLKMPPNNRLSERAVAGLAEWVRMGAPWPAESEAGAVLAKGEAWRSH